MATEDKLRDYLKRVTVELTQTRRRLAEAEDRQHEPIAIIGMACRYPGGGDTVEGFWNLLRDGGSAVTEVPPSRWDIDDYYDPDPRTPGGMYTRYGSFLPDIAGWDAEFFGLSPREALRMDPTQRLLLELAWEGLEDAGAPPSRLSGSRTGVMVGYMDSLQYGRLQLERHGAEALADPYLGQGSSMSVAAGRIAYLLNLCGPTMAIDTACSSSLIAVHLAAEALRRGECDLAIAAGASMTFHPSTFIQACAASMLCADGKCKTFDASADGYVMGEGGGVVVLEPLSKAIQNGRRIRAVIRGSAVNQDGRSNGLTAPNRGAQADVIGRALAAARVTPDDISYVEAHGSGTHLGDAIELSALHDVFGRRPGTRPLRVGAVKTNIGHTQAAAGMAGLIKTVLVLESDLIPPNLHLSDPAAAIPEDGTVLPVTGTPQPFTGAGPRLAGVSSFGWSGTNAHVILESAPEPAESVRSAAASSDSRRLSDDLPEAAAAGHGTVGGAPAMVLPVSAASDAALREHAGRLAAALAARPETARPAAALADVARTLQAGRAEHDHRRALVCADLPEAIRLLGRVATEGGVHRVKGRPRVAFLLPGVGDQYIGLGRELYRTEPVYAEAVDRCVELAADRCGVDLRPLFGPAAERSDDADSAVHQENADQERPSGVDPSRSSGLDRARPSGPDGARTSGGDLAALLGRDGPREDRADDPLSHAEVAHPFLFTVEYALARLLSHWGVTPDLLIGYSLGEYVAACLGGVFTLEDALYVVAERARLIAAAPPGRMVAVAAGEDRVRGLLAGAEFEVDVAALNGPSMTVLSGRPEDIEAVTRRLTAEGVACRPLRSAHAFHSSLLQPAREKLAALLDSVPRQAPAITIVSNLTGVALTAEQATSSQYWADQLVSPVRFADAVRHCVSQGVDVQGVDVQGVDVQEVDVFVELGPGQTLGGLVRQNLSDRPATVLGTLPPLWTAGERRDARSELLEACGRLWELGVTLNWEPTRPVGARLVDLPAYPFQRTRFWPDQGRDVPPTDRPAKPADFAFAPIWQQDTTRPTPAHLASRDVAPHLASGDGRPGDVAPAVRLSGPLVVFADSAGVGAALAESAAAAGTQVIEVVAGNGLRQDGRRIVIDPAVPEHYAQVFAAVTEPGPVQVVHLWSRLATAATPVYATDEELRAAVGYGFDSLLLAVQAMGELPARQGVRLLTVTQGAAEILGGDALAPYRAVTHGLGRAAHHEYTGLTWSGVDLDPEDDAQAAGQLVHELLREPDEAHDRLTGWRRGRRWVKSWGEVPDQGEPAGSPWRADGVYLITGGTRGLGMGLAKHLVRAGVRRLALVGRTPLNAAPHGGLDAASHVAPPEAGAGAGAQDVPEPGGKVARSLEDVAALEAAGAEVLLLTADAGVPDELRRALRRCREHFGTLTGVIHAAGVPAGGMVQRRTVAEAGAVLAPKVLAMGPLAELVGPDTPAGERPELLVLYSSAVTAFGGIGEGDYCAANTVLDAYGEALAATAPSTRVVSVAWGPWQHDDWQADSLKGASSLAQRVTAYRERYGFAEEAGCAFLDRIVIGGHGSVLAARQPLRDVLRDWSSMIDLDALVGAAAAPGGERFPRPRLRTEYVAPRSETETRIADLWGAYLGIEQVGVHDPFFDLGGNSLVGMAMVLAIEKELGVTIAPAVLFEHPTVAEFATALERSDDGSARQTLTTSSARGQRRRRARSGGGRK
ncbi:type I polyketide synthase [Nonomuraea aurantiaca]|uniref:type I polyketide synthase n=1 Tax=Nonomuraea aurantiaca TaxID=2878562 RepID=UPI001CD9FCCA|nr:type I polyketide synthase [Nonomuraea aurantiaca]MCA2220992.1 acyltransferase domain-containing protein [Nonomuraea aurantiaca]